MNDLAPARGNGAIAGFNGRETLQTRLERTAATAPDKGLVFVDRHEHETFTSWADVYARGAAVAGGLRALGVGPGDTVAVVAPTGRAFFDAFFGALLAGAVPVPLYPPVRLGRLDEYQRATAAHADGGARPRSWSPSSEPGALLGEAGASRAPELGCIDTWPSSRRPARRSTRRARGDLALIQFSSGHRRSIRSRSRSRTRNVLANARAIVSRLLEAVARRGDARRQLAAALPRHGPHRLRVPRAALPGLARAAPSRAVPRAPGALAARARAARGAIVSRRRTSPTALCIERDHATRSWRASTSRRWRLALNGAEPVSAATLRRFVDALRPLGASARGADAGLRALRGVARRHVRRRAHAVPHRALRPRRSRRRPRRADGRRRRARRASGRPLDGIELARCRCDAVGPVRVRGPSRDGGLPRPARADRGARSRRLARHGRPRLPARRRALPHGPRRRTSSILRGANHAPQEIEHALDAVPGVRTGLRGRGGLATGGRRQRAARGVRRVARAADDGSRGRGLHGRGARATGLAVDPTRSSCSPAARCRAPRRARSGAARRSAAGSPGCLIPPECLAPELLAGEWATGVLERRRRANWPRVRRAHERPGRRTPSSAAAPPGSRSPFSPRSRAPPRRHRTEARAGGQGLR